MWSLFRRTRQCQGCAELREELAKVQSRLAALVLDWETQQDKVHQWMQRTSARARTAERQVARMEGGGVEGSASGQDTVGAGGAGTHAAPLDPVSAKILARRGRGRVSGPLPPANGEES